MVYYDVIVFYDAKYYDSSGYDGLIEYAANPINPVSSGSGMGMGFRDLEFNFKTKNAALNAADRIADLRLPGVKGLWVRDHNDKILGVWRITPTLLDEFKPKAQQAFKSAPKFIYDKFRR